MTGRWSSCARFSMVFALTVLLMHLGLVSARADELWVAPTSQQDVGGLQIASNAFWPVTPIGAVRFAFAIPNNLQAFEVAKVVLIPHAPGGAATLNVFICPAQNGGAVIGACAGPFAQPFTGVTNQLAEVDISGVVAPRIGTPGATYLAVVAYTTPTTTTDHVVGMRFRYSPTPPPNVATLGANTFTGTQTAPAFVGDGSGLTNLPVPAGLATLGANTFSGTQMAPAFVGSGSGLSDVNANFLDGLDASAFAATVHGHDVSQVANAAALAGGNTFTGTQTVNAGNLDLDNSTSTTGVITKNGTRFLHDFGTFSTFLGFQAGNVTMTGPGFNTGVGWQALLSNSTGSNNTAEGALALSVNSTGFNNTAIGAVSLWRNTTGTGNTAIGAQTLYNNTTGGGNSAAGVNALANNTTGDSNTATGYTALIANTTGFYNTANGSSALVNSTTGNNNVAYGSLSLYSNTTGHRNVAVGFDAGANATTGNDNIYLGSFVEGVAGESNTMYLGKVGTQTQTVIAGVRDTTVTAGEMVVIDPEGRLGSEAFALGANSVGTNEVIDNSLTADDLGPNSVTASELAADSVTAVKVAFNYAASASEGGAASDVACAACVGASEVSFAFATPGANTFSGTQTIDTGNLDLDPSTSTTGILTKNGIRFLHNFGTLNTFLGVAAGNLTMTGTQNAAFGSDALSQNTSGIANMAAGNAALRENTEGSFNMAAGHGALVLTTTGSNNAAAGANVLQFNTIGSGNTGAGHRALFFNTSGAENVAVGRDAGLNATTGSNNIYLGANVNGVAGESNTMYLGKVGTQTRTFVAGVRGITTGVADAIPVVIDSNGQLGTVSSSRRFKEDIHDMADASERLFKLHPVTFRYATAYANGSKPIQFGLVAEEVAEVFPELAVRNANGEIETVHYETLNVLLLNEVQKQQQRIEVLEQQVQELLSRLSSGFVQ